MDSSHANKPHRKSHCYKCITCDRGFRMTILLAQHKQSVHVGIKFNCDHPVCNKSFDTKHGLKVHSSRHHMEKDKMCDTCSKLFFSTSEVCQHQKSHMETCKKCIKCDKLFTCKFELNWHFKACGSKIPYPKCGKLIAGDKNLKDHLQSKHASKENLHNVCHLCDDKPKFQYRTQLQKHMNKIHKDNII